MQGNISRIRVQRCYAMSCGHKWHGDEACQETNYDIYELGGEAFSKPCKCEHSKTSTETNISTPNA